MKYMISLAALYIYRNALRASLLRESDNQQTAKEKWMHFS